MIKLYLKQAWTLIKQNKLFTSIYVVGTGLSIALTMTMFIIFYVKFAPIYPEYNRERTLVMSAMKVYPKDNKEHTNCNDGLSYYVVSDMLKGLPHLEHVGAVGRDFMGGTMINLPDKKESFEVKLRYADVGFWDVFTFRFLSGKPFTQADVDSNLPVAVIPRSLALRIFASEDVTGKFFSMNGKEFRVCGVVEDVSTATPATAGDLWVPLFLNTWISPTEQGNILTGGTQIYMTAPSVKEKEALKEEVRDMFRKFNLQHEKFEHDLMEQPDDYWKNIFRNGCSSAPDMGNILKSLLYMLLAVLFIPAMNLSGMISSRMDYRLCELGVRKTYGATNAVLMLQVLCENLLLTCLGGVIGLLISYLIVVTASDWILTLFDDYIDITRPAPFLTFEMLFNPVVFGFAFGLCVVLNLVSALIPAAWALRRNIIQSLNTKR